ncbi:MAG: TfoX/Sxy family protein [Melioribacteraceae bacterium]|nr:TfoX/Sxy family protein [Melioribacteraceae bacterium]MCF8263774.1 TfoX/Sxy family protein [Melioribacteraceae bacterium]MCF8432346.1 TfoX/Sxy family protein [Melioribacteraceae bacterium]
MKKSEICDLKNLGPTSEKMLNSIDIYTLADIKEAGPVVICQMLKGFGFNVNIMMAYALQGAIMDLHWKDIPKEIKEQLRSDLGI